MTSVSALPITNQFLTPTTTTTSTTMNIEDSFSEQSSVLVETMINTEFTNINHHEEEDDESIDEDFNDHDDSDSDSDDNSDQEYTTSTTGKLLIYADKFIRNELIEIMEYLKNADKDRPVEEVKVHEIYL